MTPLAPLLLLVLPRAAHDPQGSSRFAFEEYHLVLDLAALDPQGLGAQDLRAADDGFAGLWRTQLGASFVSVGFKVLERPDWWGEPGDVADRALELLRGAEIPFDVTDVSFPTGPYGHAAFAAVFEAPIDSGGTKPAGLQAIVAGLLPEHGYFLHVDVRPDPGEEGRAALRRFVEQGIVYDGPVRDPLWTLDDVQERWIRDTPPDFHDEFVAGLKRSKSRKDHVHRTDHYIVLSDGAGGKLFGKKLEENYDRIVELFPFEDVPGRRLMPVFLFQSKDRYVEFYAHMAKIPEEQARKSKGHAWHDYYATYYDSPNDPVHVHEQTHQVFANRRRLSGGGSWFQEGVAEYVEARKNDLNVIAREVRDGKGTPLRELVELPSLLYSSEESVRGGGGAISNYEQAALLVEFLRESDFGAPRFGEFLRVLGRVPRGDVPRIEAGFRRVYGLGLEEIEARWRTWCAER